MVDFFRRDDMLITEGHDLDEDAMRTALVTALSDRRPAQAAANAEQAQLSEVWYSEEHGIGHDCALHQDVDRELWAPGCRAGGFRPVTVATGIPVPRVVERIEQAPVIAAAVT